MEEQNRLAYSVLEPTEPAAELTPVILLHGMLDSKLTWKKVAPKIASLTGRKVYSIDARNHGDSPWQDDLTFDDLTDDLERFMNNQNITRAILVGHSMGGKIAMKLADRNPDRVEKLIVEDMTAKRLPFATGWIVAQSLRILRYAITQVPEGADEMTARKTIGRFVAILSPENNIPQAIEDMEFNLLRMPIKKVGEKYVWKTNLDALEKALMSKQSWEKDLHGQFPREALFLYGPSSFIDLENHEEVIKKFFPKAEIVMVEGAGHLIHIPFSDVFVKEVVDFIKKASVVE